MVRDGELDPHDYLATAAAHLPEENDLAIVQGVLTFAHTQIAGRYIAPHQRTAALATLTTIARDLLRRTEDGSEPGMRLTAVRTLVDSATQPDTIAAWLTDDTVPGGPALDPELRWRILGRLAVLGAVGETEIDAALAADTSATGQEGAARCRAALPTPQAKAAAWDRLFHDDSLSNYLFSATAQGFWQPEQTELLTEYVTRYYPEAIALGARRGPAMGEYAGRWAFPAYAIDEATSGRATPASPTRTSSPSCAANWSTNSTTCPAPSKSAGPLRGAKRTGRPGPGPEPRPGPGRGAPATTGAGGGAGGGTGCRPGLHDLWRPGGTGPYRPTSATNHVLRPGRHPVPPPPPPPAAPAGRYESRHPHPRPRRRGGTRAGDGGGVGCCPGRKT